MAFKCSSRARGDLFRIMSQLRSKIYELKEQKATSDCSRDYHENRNIILNYTPTGKVKASKKKKYDWRNADRIKKDFKNYWNKENKNEAKKM